jgi:hypothetical protein
MKKTPVYHLFLYDDSGDLCESMAIFNTLEDGNRFIKEYMVREFRKNYKRTIANFCAVYNISEMDDDTLIQLFKTNSVFYFERYYLFT